MCHVQIYSTRIKKNCTSVGVAIRSATKFHLRNYLSGQCCGINAVIHIRPARGNIIAPRRTNWIAEIIRTFILRLRKGCTAIRQRARESPLHEKSKHFPGYIYANQVRTAWFGRPMLEPICLFETPLDLSRSCPTESRHESRSDLIARHSRSLFQNKLTMWPN